MMSIVIMMMIVKIWLMINQIEMIWMMMMIMLMLLLLLMWMIRIMKLWKIKTVDNRIAGKIA